MYYLVALIILVLAVLLISKLLKRTDVAESETKQEEEPRQVASDCCGAHEICEFEESDFNEEIIIYFNDEELDELRNIRETELTSTQIDELREVLYTLRKDEISKWLTSISRRHIHFPSILQQEARQLMTEN